MTDFFVSYTLADKVWAEWIAYVLEEAGWSVIIQAWDFRPGSNFVMEMQRAASEASRTVMVLSPDYPIVGVGGRFRPGPHRRTKQIGANRSAKM
jgi:hypothetical protein